MSGLWIEANKEDLRRAEKWDVMMDTDASAEQLLIAVSSMVQMAMDLWCENDPAHHGQDEFKFLLALQMHHHKLLPLHGEKKDILFRLQVERKLQQH